MLSKIKACVCQLYYSMHKAFRKGKKKLNRNCSASLHFSYRHSICSFQRAKLCYRQSMLCWAVITVDVPCSRDKILWHKSGRFDQLDAVYIVGHLSFLQVKKCLPSVHLPNLFEVPAHHTII